MSFVCEGFFCLYEVCVFYLVFACAAVSKKTKEERVGWSQKRCFTSLTCGRQEPASCSETKNHGIWKGPGRSPSSPPPVLSGIRESRNRKKKPKHIFSKRLPLNRENHNGTQLATVIDDFTIFRVYCEVQRNGVIWNPFEQQKPWKLFNVQRTKSARIAFPVNEISTIYLRGKKITQKKTNQKTTNSNQNNKKTFPASSPLLSPGTVITFLMSTKCLPGLFKSAYFNSNFFFPESWVDTFFLMSLFKD